MAKLVNNFEVGCDPEFILVDKAAAIVNVKGRLLQTGPVGWDHSGYVLELRPEQGRGTYSLIKRMQSLLRDEKMKKFVEHKWRAGAHYTDSTRHVELGGHIHFGINKTQFTQEMIEALDTLSKALEELDILPTQENKNRRRFGYGQYGSIRSDWADGHVEYRTFSSWLNDPNIAFLVLTLAKLVVVDPEGAKDFLKLKSRAGLFNFIGRFKHKDINADRLLMKLESPSWLKTPPDADMKKGWKCDAVE